MHNIFGMFIHWGIYSQLKSHEQVLARYDMENRGYEKLIHTFDPVNYDPEEWVLLAKRAGMKYICFTTKHHDGFCMWDTKYTDYNIMHTPYGRDVTRMLAEACKKHGMKLSFYYSCPDWYHENAYNPNSTHQWKAADKEKGDTAKYREFVKNQITELLTAYGEIYTLFWDIPPRIRDESINALVRRLQPGILINNRGYDEGDFSTPERELDEIAESGHFEKMTEACNSVGEQSWGY
ncbi:MAG: alpha-L-fucosidase, partial [Clostridia bacterium]|nr:alpha-L-fucosidase [Clostridia bacterium]